MSLVVFTDLDGTLLDAATYSWEAARSALEQCHTRGALVIAVTSKTMAETRVASEAIGLDERFIFENGGGIYVGGEQYLALGMPYEDVRRGFAFLARQFPLQGMGDMSVVQVADLTGLTIEEAAMARQRLFTEPFLYHGDDLGVLMAAAAGLGFQVVRGGRFYHLMAAEQSKGAAIQRLVQNLEKESGVSLVTAALGDSPNDFPMLAVVDHPFLVRHKDGQATECPLDTVIITGAAGPAGWSEAVSGLLAAWDRRSLRRGVHV
ncbi:MAG: HAD-IIB family hydrolase [Deltaproteobacteria bacterium]|nr:HAD-IIB family hydrolase [Candidatus Anaeroferrophillus wilburensis]MBN2888767.1 HAD-IIB family hydrolase [Deltaproteobacteria bacterium]